jgi:hypothetical protein
MYAFEPSGEKARLAGREPTKTVLSTASVFVLMIAIEFWDGIVAYISGRVGCITSDEAGKLYSATVSPKAAWALFGAIRALTEQTTVKKSRLGLKRMKGTDRESFFIQLRQVCAPRIRGRHVLCQEISGKCIKGYCQGVSAAICECYFRFRTGDVDASQSQVN